MDPYYREGSDVSSFCHRKDGNTEKGVAGKFGVLGSDCDSPKALVEAAFEFMKDQAPDADFVVYTGDSTRHDRDKQLKRTREQVTEIQKTIVNYFKESFSKVVKEYIYIQSFPFLSVINSSIFIYIDPCHR